MTLIILFLVALFLSGVWLGYDIGKNRYDRE